jgi:hypothetical protein
VGCSLIGSLGVSYTGALLANLAIALFALVAIESSSQVLGRTYGVLLICAILLDIVWFILFSVEIRYVITLLISYCEEHLHLASQLCECYGYVCSRIFVDNVSAFNDTRRRTHAKCAVCYIQKTVIPTVSR